MRPGSGGNTPGAKGKRRPPAFTPMNPPNVVVQPMEQQDQIPEGLSPQVNVRIDGQEMILSPSELEKIKPLGEGQYGLVECMRHKSSGVIIAVKKIRISMENARQRRILKDMDVSMRSSNCPYVIISYGALFHDGDVWICMELMDISCDHFYKMVLNQKKKIPENILAYLTYCVVSALEYLHSETKVIHRDVKPSNILIDRTGRVKVCDFGISGELTNSMAKTNVGSELYLAPERIDSKGQGYRIQSDVWSLGITLLELALGKFPYSGWNTFFDKLKDVVFNPSPVLPADAGYSDCMRNFIAQTLTKEDSKRPDYVTLLQHEFLTGLDLDKMKLVTADFVREVLEASNQSPSGD